MAKIVVEEQKEFTLLPAETILHLKVDELKIKDVKGQHGDWQKLEFKFKVLGIQAVGGGGNPEHYEDIIAGPIWGSVPFRLTDSPENKLRQWAEAILGLQLGVGYELDTDLFLGRECRGVTTQYEKRNLDSRGQKQYGHQVESLLPKASGPLPQGGQQDPWQQQPQQQQQWAPQPPQQQAPQGYAQQAYQNQVAPQQQQQPIQDPWGTQGNGGWGGGDEPGF